MIALSVSLTACYTVKGAGQDIKKGGNAIQKSASDNTTY
jgi:predicted small secreted protein